MSLLTSFSDALEARDPYLQGHSTRVTAFAEGLARLLGWRRSELEALRLGGSLHDVGKIAVDAGILRKPGRLTEAELAHIRTHPVAGARLIEGVADLVPALPYVLHHHERWDGKGYPHGKAADQIPVEARLLGVADAFDAMTSHRPYRRALTVERGSRRGGTLRGDAIRSHVRPDVRRGLAPGRDQRIGAGVRDLAVVG